MTAIKMADAEYFALARLSFSSIKYLISSPRKFIHQKEEPFEGNEATRLGSALHAWLQGEKDKVVFEPDLSGLKTKKGEAAKNPRATAEGKEILEQFKAQVPAGSIVLPAETLQILEGVERNWYDNDDVQSLRAQATHIEKAHIFNIDGLPFKGKFDEEGKGFVTDYKSSGKPIDPENVYREIKSKHYDLQAAIYATAKAEEEECDYFDIKYFMVFFETFKPFDVYCYQLSEKSMQEGLEKLQKVIENYKKYFINQEKIYNKLLVV